jgi:DNA-directed RNA polymerase subunit RPC12/RpoP
LSREGRSFVALGEAGEPLLGEIEIWSKTVVTAEASGTRQRILLIGAVVLLIVAGLLLARHATKSSSAERFASDRVFKCVDCAHEFEHDIKMGEIEPLACPKCGKQAGWMTEKCYWTHDAEGNWKAKLNPTYVVLKSRIDPGSTEKTYCPDCGHIVVGHNPRPPRDLMEAAEKEAKNKD